MDSDAQEKAVKKVAEGILLEGDHEPTKPAILEFIDETHARLTLEQGKYHQVKRMMGYFGNKVVELHRASIGHINLDGLDKGDSRFLTAEEVAKF
ncbi:ribosomal small subunit pseudouridine synthase A [Streptococcus pneumoniae]|nr:ribosomal small subunit pseudouridine synthase A [Streptococcus pneumoniae]